MGHQTRVTLDMKKLVPREDNGTLKLDLNVTNESNEKIQNVMSEVS